MRTTQYFFPTLKETPSDAEIISDQLMLRAGMIRKLASGIYTWLPLGLRVLRKVETVVREEMNRSGALELLMSATQPAEFWQESDFCYGPTQEEIITDLARRELRSYKQLPFLCYQIQNKFRNETRPHFEEICAREFAVKDAYSFHTDDASMQETYQRMYNTYCQIFTRLGLTFCAVLADTESIDSKASHTFQISADSTIEVGHISQLDNKYSTAMNATVLNEEGKTTYIKMGWYSINLSRIVTAAIEQNYDDRGIIWPEPMSPFQIAIIPMSMHKSYRVKELSEKLYQDLQIAGFDVLFDDRKDRVGVLFADMDLTGIPHRLIVGERGIDNGTIEYQNRKTNEAQNLSLDNIIQWLKEKMFCRE